MHYGGDHEGGGANTATRVGICAGKRGTEGGDEENSWSTVRNEWNITLVPVDSQCYIFFAFFLNMLLYLKNKFNYSL